MAKKLTPFTRARAQTLLGCALQLVKLAEDQLPASHAGGLDTVQLLLRAAYDKLEAGEPNTLAEGEAE